MLSRGAIRALVFCFAFDATLVSAESRAGELQKASDNIHGSGRSASSSRSSSAPSSRGASGGEAHTDDSDDESQSAAAGLLFYTILSPFWAPHDVLEAAPQPAEGWSIASPPYAAGAPGSFEPVASPPEPVGPWLLSSGLLDSTPSQPRYQVAPERRRVAAFQATAEAIAPVAGVARVQAGVRLLTAFRLELDAAYALYVERSDAPVTPSAWSGAWLGHAHLSFQFARGEHVQFRAGLGVRHWVDAQGASAGIDLLYGVDIFPARPISVCLEFTGGTLGNAWVAEPRATAGWILGPGEVYAGYDAVWVGGHGPTASLGGPVAGVRMYF